MSNSVDDEGTTGSPSTTEQEDKDLRGIKRTRLACDNCRRKKVRCSGTRPACSFCLRLSQSCHYTEGYMTAQGSRSETEAESSENSLLMRIELLEAQLNQSRSIRDSESPPANYNTIGGEFGQDSAYLERVREIKVEQVRAAMARAQRLQEEEDNRARRRLEEEEDRRRRLAQEAEDRARREAIEIEEHNRNLRQLEAQARRDTVLNHHDRASSGSTSIGLPRSGQLNQLAGSEKQGNVSDFFLESCMVPKPAHGFLSNHNFAAAQLSTSMPPLQALQDTINCYFRLCYNQPYSLFHEDSFRRRFESGLVPDYLIYLLVVYGLRLSRGLQTHEYFEDRATEFATLYTKESWRLILQHWEFDDYANIAMAQAITLHATLDFTEGRIHKAWVKIGIAVRVCQDLGLMLEPDANLPVAEQEELRRVFWSVYMQDKLVSCGKGRVSAIQDEDCKVQLPCNERSFRMGLPVKTLQLGQLINREAKLDCSLGPFALAVFTVSVLGRCARCCLHECPLAPWDPTSDEYTSITSTLLYFECSFYMREPLAQVLAKDYTTDGILDQQAAAHLLFAHVIFNLCQCLLNLPLLLKATSTISCAPESFFRRALHICREHATSLTSLLRDAEAIGCRASSSVYGYCCIVAGTIHALDSHSDTESVRMEATRCLEFSLAFLQNLSRYWKNAGLMFQWLQKFCEHSARYSVALRIPSTIMDITELHSDELRVLWGCIDYNVLSQGSSMKELQELVPTPTKTPGDTMHSLADGQTSSSWHLHDPYIVNTTEAVQPFNMEFNGAESMQHLAFDIDMMSGALLDDEDKGVVNNNEDFSGSGNRSGTENAEPTNHDSPLSRFLLSQSTE